MTESNAVRFRSKFARYRWKGVKFENNIAVVANQRTITAMQADPHFGEGRDFWIDADVESVEEPEATDPDDTGSVDGDNKPSPDPDESTTKKSSSKKATTKRTTRRKSGAK